MYQMQQKVKEESELQKVENPLGYKSIWRLLASFSGPTIIATLVYSIYNIVDQIYIGQGVGYLGNATASAAPDFDTLSADPASHFWAGWRALRNAGFWYLLHSGGSVFYDTGNAAAKENDSGKQFGKLNSNIIWRYFYELEKTWLRPDASAAWEPGRCDESGLWYVV